MKVLSGKARERLLYLISPIALIALWQVLLMLGVGDRRFIPAPSDIAQRFVKLVASGELAWHVGVTLYRVALGYVSARCPRSPSVCSWQCSSRCASSSTR